MSGLFVTATGTDVGKTYVTAGLLRAGRRAGVAIDAMKPILTGFGDDDLAASDAGVLLEALDVPVTPDAVARIAPFRFAAPLAPAMAAPLEGRALDILAVAAACRARLRPDRLTLIEGIGGVMVPLDAGLTVLDLIEALAVPVVLVTGTALGALSHCLTAASVLQGRGIRIGAVVVNESAGSSVSPFATRETLAGFLAPVRTAMVPRQASDACFDALLPLVTGVAR